MSDAVFLTSLMADFKETLQKHATLEGFIEWLDFIIEKEVLRKAVTSTSVDALKKHGRNFVLTWTYFSSRVSHCLTLKNAASFGVWRQLYSYLHVYESLIFDYNRIQLLRQKQ